MAVALSGGRDSVALFARLCELADELGIEVSAINVDHGIRGAASAADSEFVKKVAKNAEKRLFFAKEDVPAYAQKHKMGLEEAAREVRYNCFFRALDEGFCDKIATAHHADDNAETVLFNIFRGSGPKGLCGIAESAYGGRLIRPMLGVTRNEIDAYIAQKRLVFVNDGTNEETAYDRNYLRHEVIPVIERRFPNLADSVKRLGGIISAEDALLDELAAELVGFEGGFGLVKVPEGTRRCLLERAVIIAMKGAGLKKDYEAVHVQAVAALADGRTGAAVDLPHGMRATRTYGAVKIGPAREYPPFVFPFAEGCYDLPGGRLCITLTDAPAGQKAAFFAKEKQKGVLYAAAEAVLADAVIRTREDGDYMAKFGGGTKSLKKILIDLKVERAARQTLPVCAVGKEILFVAGLEISARAAVCGGRCYRIEYKQRETDK